MKNSLPGAFEPREGLHTDLPDFGTAAVLAGGKSTRMGFDKQLLMEDDRRILERVIETLKQEFGDILIVTARPELYEGMDVRIFGDEYQGKGPLAGVHTALRHARSRYVYLLACDMPVVCREFIRHMKARLLETKADICVCRYDGRLEPFNTFYAADLLPDVTRRLETGNSSLYRFIESGRACVIEQEEAARFDGKLSMFTNINTRSEYEKYLGSAAEGEGDASLVAKKDIVRYISGDYVQLRDLMVHETALELEIEGVGRRTLYCSPCQLRELVLGHLCAEGYIRSLTEVSSLELDEISGRAAVRLAPQKEQSPRPLLRDDLCFDPEILLKNQQQFYDRSVLQKATAGTHRCALCDDSGTHLACVDISRHNCMDKLAGKALLAGISLADKYILTSGRIPMDMIRKVAAIGVPMIVSRSTPTIAAVEEARRANITLLGFSRENRFNIYSAPHRLKDCELLIGE